MSNMSLKGPLRRGDFTDLSDFRIFMSVTFYKIQRWPKSKTRRFENFWFQRWVFDFKFLGESKIFFVENFQHDILKNIRDRNLWRVSARNEGYSGNSSPPGPSESTWADLVRPRSRPDFLSKFSDRKIPRIVISGLFVKNN